MRRTYIALLVIFAFATSVSSCKKEECPQAEFPACKEVAPTNEACQAVFQRWFFNKATNACELKAYSGCGAYGFATEIDCKDCACN